MGAFFIGRGQLLMDGERKKSDQKYYVFALRIIGEITGLIAVPVVLLALFGQRLDERWGTAPKLLIAGFVIAALISGFSVWRRAKQLGKEYQSLDSD